MRTSKKANAHLAEILGVEEIIHAENLCRFKIEALLAGAQEAVDVLEAQELPRQ
jgi:hypothetical protein